MALQKSVRTFIQEAIKGLSKEEFDELVRIFQLSYWHYSEIVNVDGANDGGSDIKVYHNKKEQKKCIQVTVQKHGLELKINNDLKKIAEKISKFGYSNRMDFFCSTSISEEKIEEFKKKALEEYNIILEIYEAKRLSQLNCKEVVDYIYSLHQDIVLKPEQLSIDKATETLYDLLAYGKDTSDIKNCLVDSVIISILYEKAPIDMSDLKEELEKRLGKDLPDIIHSVNLLKTDRRVVKSKENPKLLCLSELEQENVKAILASSTKTENEFRNSFANILAKYNINSTQSILEELKKLYKKNYSQDIHDSNKGDEPANYKVFESFKKLLKSFIANSDQIDSLINEIKDLCLTNSYLNKICASESFLSLYKSNQLEHYLNQKHKEVYLDTPTFVYLVCAFYGIDNNDWDNPYYRSMKSLIKLKESYSDKISFYITQNYLGEVVGEIRKALIFSQFERYPFFEEMGGTRNTLFNYYKYLKKENLFEHDDRIEHFNDFMYSLGLDNTNPHNTWFFKDAVRFLRQVAESYDISVINLFQHDRYVDFKELYERILFLRGKNKSETAIRNDVNQVITSFEHKNETDCYFATWDTTIHLLRDEVLQRDELLEYNYFSICNPARLSNRIALENFNIDESVLTNDIFAYADNRYDISNRVKSLLELIAPFLIENGSGSKKLFKKLARIRREQIELRGSESGSEQEEKNLPVEEIFMLLIPSKEQIKEDRSILNKFSIFMSSEENTDYIIDIINKVSELKDYRMYDFTEFFNKIESIDISSLDGEHSIKTINFE